MCIFTCTLVLLSTSGHNKSNFQLPAITNPNSIHSFIKYDIIVSGLSPFHVAPLGTTKGYNALFSQHIQRKRIHTFLVNHHKAFIVPFTHLENTHKEDHVIISHENIYTGFTLGLGHRSMTY